MSDGNLDVVRAMYERREGGDMYVGEFVDLSSSGSGQRHRISPGSGTVSMASDRLRLSI